MEKAVKPERILWRRWSDGRLISCTRCNPEFSSWFGAPYYVAHRAHLHEMLHDQANKLGVRIHLSRRIKCYDIDVPSVTFADGQDIHVDLVVAADG
jgi:salicylate hydroxylase